MNHWKDLLPWLQTQQRRHEHHLVPNQMFHRLVCRIKKQMRKILQGIEIPTSCRCFFWFFLVSRVRCNVSHRIHGTGMFIYMWLQFIANVGIKKTCMEHLGFILLRCGMLSWSSILSHTPFLVWQCQRNECQGAILSQIIVESYSQKNSGETLGHTHWKSLGGKKKQWNQYSSDVMSFKFSPSVFGISSPCHFGC